MNAYKLCLVLAGRGRLTSRMIDVYYAAGRLTDEQAEELYDLTAKAEDAE